MRAVVFRSEALGEQQRGHRDAAVVVADSPDGHLHAVVTVAPQVEVVRRIAAQKNVVVQRNAHEVRMDMDERRPFGGMDHVPQPGFGDGWVRAAQVLGQVVRAGGHAVVRNLLLVEARKQCFRGRSVVGEGREGGRHAAQRNGMQFEARRALLPERDAQIEPCEASLQPQGNLGGSFHADALPGGHGDTPSGELLVVAQRQRTGGQSFGRQLARIAPRIGQCEQFVVARGQAQRNAATGIFEVEMLGGFGRRFMEEVEAQIVHGTLLYGAVAAAGHGLRT